MRHSQRIGTVVRSHVPSEGVDTKMKEGMTDSNTPLGVLHLTDRVIGFLCIAFYLSRCGTEVLIEKRRT